MVKFIFIIFLFFIINIYSKENTLINIEKILQKGGFLFDKKLVKYLDKIKIINLSKILTKNSFDAGVDEILWSYFTYRLFDKEQDKIEKVEKIFKSDSTYYWKIFANLSDNLIKRLYTCGIQYKKSNNIIDLYKIKRYLVTFWIYPQLTYLSLAAYIDYIPMEYCINDRKDCYQNGLWAMYDSDVATTAKFHKDDFYIVIKPGEEFLIFNGNGFSKEDYFKNNRIKKLSGYLPDNSKVDILLDDIYNWQTIKIPGYVNEIKIKSIHGITKNKREKILWEKKVGFYTDNFSKYMIDFDRIIKLIIKTDHHVFEYYIPYKEDEWDKYSYHLTTKMKHLIDNAITFRIEKLYQVNKSNYVFISELRKKGWHDDLFESKILKDLNLK